MSGKPEALRELAEALHVRALAVQVHRHDRAHASAAHAVVELVRAALAVLFEELLDEVHAQVERRRVDVEEHRAGADARDRAAGREERVGRRDDLVARPEVVGHERDQERVRAGRQADAVLRAAIRGDVGLELA